MIQMLWDRGEGAGYVHHVVDDPLPGTPAKTVLLHVAFGDWQVSELSAFVAARTMGIPIHRPVTADGRSREVEPGLGPRAGDLPDRRVGPRRLGLGLGSDPRRERPAQHRPRPARGPARRSRRAAQKAAFLFDGQLIDVCDAAACPADAS